MWRLKNLMTFELFIGTFFWNRSTFKCGMNLNYLGNEKELTMLCTKCVNYLLIYHGFFLLCLSLTSIQISIFVLFPPIIPQRFVRTTNGFVYCFGSFSPRYAKLLPSIWQCYRNSVSCNDRKFIVSDRMKQKINNIFIWVNGRIFKLWTFLHSTFIHNTYIYRYRCVYCLQRRIQKQILAIKHKTYTCSAFDCILISNSMGNWWSKLNLPV